MLAAPRPEPIGEAEEVRLVDGVQDFHHRPLDDLVLQRRRCPVAAAGRRVWGCTDAATASLDTHPVVRVRSRSARLPSRPVFVLVPCDAVDAGRRSPFQLVERPAEQVDGDMVQECREPNTLVPSCSFTYAVQCGGYAFPALRLARAAPDRIALGPAPSLHRLRGRRRGVVRRLHRYYGRVRLPLAVHHRITGATLPMRTARDGLSRMASQRISRFPCRWLPRVREVSDHAGSGLVLAIARRPVLPSALSLRRRHPGRSNFSRLNTLPACSPVNASPASLRMPTHDSGSS